jgi:hypothetical protein
VNKRQHTPRRERNSAAWKNTHAAYDRRDRDREELDAMSERSERWRWEGDAARDSEEKT